jgi:hypothetical protein
MPTLSVAGGLFAERGDVVGDDFALVPLLEAAGCDNDAGVAVRADDANADFADDGLAGDVDRPGVGAAVALDGIAVGDEVFLKAACADTGLKRKAVVGETGDVTSRLRARKHLAAENELIAFDAGGVPWSSRMGRMPFPQLMPLKSTTTG